MQKHAKIYLNSFGIDEFSYYIKCEVCQKEVNDIHHISARGMGGSTQKNFIENLMALCRDCHDLYGDKKQFISLLYMIHFKCMLDEGLMPNKARLIGIVPADELELIHKYSVSCY